MRREQRWVVAVDRLGGTHRKGEVVRPEDFPGKEQWERLVEIGAVVVEQPGAAVVAEGTEG